MHAKTPFGGLRPLARPSASALASYASSCFDPSTFLDPGAVAPPVPKSLRPAAADLVSMAELHADIIGPGGQLALATLDGWMRRPLERGLGYKDVQDFVLATDHSVLHRLTVAEVEAATVWPRDEWKARHALGDVEASEQMETVENFDTPWTFNYIGHMLLQRLGRLPTWPEFDAHLRGDGRGLYYGPFADHFRTADMSQAEKVRHARALRWRVGKGYYSFVREVDFLVRLRQEYGLSARYHVLADTLFRVDAWCGRVLLALNIINPKYKGNGEGRKLEPSRVMDISGFAFRRLELEVPQSFGKPMLVAPAAIARAAAEIKHAAEG